MKPRDFDRVVKKFGMEILEGRHVTARLKHDGRLVAFTMRSHGSAEVPERLVQRQLFLTKSQLSKAVECTIQREDYIGILKRKDLL